MWEEVMKIAVSNGIFAVLFCSLLIYELRVTGKRENKYQMVIDGLTKSLTSLKNVENDLESIERLLGNVLGSRLGENRRNEHSEKVESAVSIEET